MTTIPLPVLPSVVQKEMIGIHQCSGCMKGSDPDTCESFKFQSEPSGRFNCGGWYPGTFLLGVGRILLGMPTGFNKAGNVVSPEYLQSGNFLGLFDSPQYVINGAHVAMEPGQPSVFDGWYNKLNVPVWALEKGGYLYVKVFAPRKNSMYIEVIKDGTMDIFDHFPDISKPINVAEFIDQID